MGIKNISDIIKFQQIEQIRNINPNITIRTENRLTEFRNSVINGDRTQVEYYLKQEKSYKLDQLGRFYTNTSTSSPENVNYRCNDVSTTLKTPRRSNCHLNQQKTNYDHDQIDTPTKSIVSMKKFSTPIFKVTDFANKTAENLDTPRLQPRQESNDMDSIIEDLQTSIAKIGLDDKNQNGLQNLSANISAIHPKDLDNLPLVDHNYHRAAVVGRQEIRKIKRAADAIINEIPLNCREGGCKMKTCRLISQDQWEQIFDEFWSLPSQEAQQNYIVQSFIRNKKIYIKNTQVCLNFTSAMLGSVPHPTSTTGYALAFGIKKIRNLRNGGLASITIKGGSKCDEVKFVCLKEFIDQCIKLFSHYKRTDETKYLLRVTGFAQNKDGLFLSYEKYSLEQGNQTYGNSQFKDIWKLHYFPFYTLTFSRESHCDECFKYENETNRTEEIEAAQRHHKDLVAKNTSQRVEFLKLHNNKIVSIDLQKILHCYDNLKLEGSKLNYLGQRPNVSNNTFASITYNPTAKSYGPQEINDLTYRATAMCYSTPHPRDAVNNAYTMIRYMIKKNLSGNLLFELDNSKAQSKSYLYYMEIFGFLLSKDNNGIDQIICHYLEKGHSFMTRRECYNRFYK